VCFIIFCVQFIRSEDYTCVWYKECGYNEDGKVRNCLSNTTAQLINDDDAENILFKRCPHLFEDISKIAFYNNNDILNI
jgi:hypothetical protein